MRTLAMLALAALLAIPAAAADITGSVTNGTTGKPAAGVDVVLLNLNEGMQEAARTQSGKDGKFKFTVADANAPYLVRAVYKDVTYHKPLMPGGGSNADLQVFESAEKVDGISVVAQIMRVQSTDGSRLEVAELYTVKNDSNPPRTQFSDRSFEVILPKEAQIEAAMALAPGSTAPVSSAPVPVDDKGRHGFFFPLRPGDTRFQITYNLPYKGEAKLQPHVLYPVQHVVLVMPSTMQFTTEAAAGLYQPMQDSPGTNVQVATNVGPGQDLSFNIKGTGIIPTEDQAQGGQGQGQPQQGQPGSGPGGGMAPPTGTPTPLGQYQWWILGGLAIILAAGAFFFLKQTGTEPATASTAPPRSSAAVAADITRPAGRESLLIEALKEELFQLEMDKHRGNVSAEEYKKAKAALDLIIERAATRVTTRV